MTLNVVLLHVTVFTLWGLQVTIGREKSGVLDTPIDWGMAALRITPGQRDPILLQILWSNSAWWLNTAISTAEISRIGPKRRRIRLTAPTSRFNFLNVQHLVRTGTNTLAIVYTVPTISKFKSGG